MALRFLGGGYQTAMLPLPIDIHSAAHADFSAV
jgi:hypothetical protein